VDIGDVAIKGRQNVIDQQHTHLANIAPEVLTGQPVCKFVKSSYRKRYSDNYGNAVLAIQVGCVSRKLFHSTEHSESYDDHQQERRNNKSPAESPSEDSVEPSQKLIWIEKAEPEIEPAFKLAGRGPVVRAAPLEQTQRIELAQEIHQGAGRDARGIGLMSAAGDLGQREGAVELAEDSILGLFD
jgi:hypothetical protein